MARRIGIQHRVKQTAEGEARPTKLFIAVDDLVGTSFLELDTETDELDWVRGRFPTAYRAVTADDDLSKFSAHHIKWKALKEDDDLSQYPKNLLKKEKKTMYLATKVPSSYEGLTAGDTVVMILGGSGDALASAISRQGEKVEATAFRTPAAFVKASRPLPPHPENWDSMKTDDRNEWYKKNQIDSSGDAKLLVELFDKHPEKFYQVRPRDRDMIWLVRCFHSWMETMKKRVECEQRIWAGTVGQIFASPDGELPTGTIEECYEDLKEKDPAHAALVKEEARRKRDLETALEKTPIYAKVLSKIEGLGPSIAGRIISAVQDIRRFQTIAGFKAFCGVHVLKDGRFARRRKGELANWHPNARQAFYLAVEQFNRREGTVWGQKLRENKRKLREKHPEVVVVNSKKRYTDGHIHNMGTWRTATRFSEFVYREWKKLELQEQNKQPDPELAPAAVG